MIKIENFEVMGWDHVIRGMRNPMNSWNKSDSGICKGGDDGIGCENCANQEPCHHAYNASWQLGKADHELMMKLAKAGSVHGKFRRMITVYVDITAPLYWWKEFDTYKVGTVANSCSTMHKIHAKEFTIDDFSHEHLTSKTDGLWVNADGKDFMCSAYDFCQITCDVLNFYRNKFLETKDKKYWWQMIQLLPSSYNQKRTIMLNYEVLSNIYQYRREHKLDEWREFCQWIERLPYSEIIVDAETVKLYADNKEVGKNKMYKDLFDDYKIGFEKFLKSEGGKIYVQCKTFNEALYGLQELMKMVDFDKFHALAYSIPDRLYYWEFYKENTVFCLTASGSTYTNVKYVREKGEKLFSYQGFDKRMKYFMYVNGKKGVAK